ncbi:S-formylglutathione hydrolase FrmB [Cetobacterium ceti]|uniref:S-formylglutathione hydrolase FrmB n=1 Tax=Cetobacterium ceti TaxID=180163 RepID=A0A1T4M805_9FUSO|nr:alpha/beta hydrolase-fold protein [Cetobacterium ceti]SJZ63052.1 S-formylglutathione hydrolase FrmB [Cetobacterium ceti]
MNLKLFIGIVLILSLLFYVITYPYESKLLRKLKRVRSFKEVTYIENPEIKYENYSLEEIEERLSINEYVFPTDLIDENIRYLTIKPKNVTRDNIPCVILLHGLRDFPEDWINKGKLLENYLTLLDKKRIEEMVFILPYSGYNGTSWYSNFYGDKKHRYEDWLSDEFFKIIRENFPKSKIGIGGFSMGGYGAFKIGLKNIDKFHVIGSFSGAVSLIRMSVNRRVMRIFKYLYIPKFLFNEMDKAHFIKVFSSWGYKVLREDPYSILKKIPSEKIKEKKIYISVGSEDKKPYLMLQQWIDVVGRLKKYKYNFKGILYNKEMHTWDYISKDLPNFLKYFHDCTK